MPTKRTLYIISALGIAAVAALTSASRPQSTATTPFATLTTALDNMRAGRGTPEIATDDNHRTIVSDSSVTWYDAQGHQYITPLTSSLQALRAFDAGGFYNYQIETGPTIPAPLRFLPPAIILVALFFAIRFLRARRRRQPRAGE